MQIFPFPHMPESKQIHWKLCSFKNKEPRNIMHFPLASRVIPTTGNVGGGRKKRGKMRWGNVIHYKQISWHRVEIRAVFFPGGSVVKRICLQCRRHGFNPWVGKILWRRKWQPTPVFLPEKSHEQRSLASYSPWGHKESDTTEWLINSKQFVHQQLLYKVVLASSVQQNESTIHILSFLKFPPHLGHHKALGRVPCAIQ